MFAHHMPRTSSCRFSPREQSGLWWMAAGCLLAFSVGFAWAHVAPQIRVYQAPVETSFYLQLPDAGAIPSHAWSPCLQQAARASGVDPALFHAIVKVESGQHPFAFGWYDPAGFRRSYRAPSYTKAVEHLEALEERQIRFDVGLAQVNSRNLKILSLRTGIAPVQALDPCVNLHLAGIILQEQIRIHGPTWKAVAGYNGAPNYAPRVHRVYCSQVPHGAGCHAPPPLPHLLCDPLPGFEAHEGSRTTLVTRTLQQITARNKV